MKRFWPTIAYLRAPFVPDRATILRSLFLFSFLVAVLLPPLPPLTLSLSFEKENVVAPKDEILFLFK